jgi:2-dehydropantoate 2-reductase
MTKVLIFGAGGVGCIYGYFVHKGGADVTAVCRTNYEAAKAHGITIRSKLFGNVHYQPQVVRAVSDAQGPFDFILVCSKAFPGTSKMIEGAVSLQTAIVLAQNGIGIEDEYAEMYPNNTIISGVVWLPTTQVEPGRHQCFYDETVQADLTQ